MDNGKTMGCFASVESPISYSYERKKLMSKKIRNYLIAIVVVFLLVLLASYFFVELTWSESAFLSAFLTVIGVGSYWWKEEGLG